MAFWNIWYTSNIAKMQNVPYLDLSKSKNIKENLAFKSNISIYSLQIRGKNRKFSSSSAGVELSQNWLFVANFLCGNGHDPMFDQKLLNMIV